MDEHNHPNKPQIETLKAEQRFAEARGQLNKAIKDDPHNPYLNQQLALCTYKDENLPHAKRFADAIQILEGIGLRDASTRDPATERDNHAP